MSKTSLELIIEIVGTANGLGELLQQLNEVDPIAAGNTFKTVLAILRDKDNTKTVFTFAELEKFGYLKPI